MILFLTRKYPPVKGGMETFSWELTTRYRGENLTIARGRKQWHIVWVIPALMYHVVLHAAQAKLFHLGDLVLAPVAKLAKTVSNAPVVATVHGLELTHKSKLLRRVIDSGLPYIDHFVCVSDYTAGLLKERGVAASKISVITHGVTEPETLQKREDARAQVGKSIGLNAAQLEKTTLLLSVGRLVTRKGVRWFIEDVMPTLHEDIHLIVASSGPEQAAIEAAIDKHGLDGRVHLLGLVSARMLESLYAGSDLFIMPNIHIDRDAEGFGFVGVEAAVRGLPVLASGVDGIPSAINHGKNGLLIAEKDVKAWNESIEAFVRKPVLREKLSARGREYTQKKYRWDDKIAEYTSLFESLINKK